MEAPMNKSIMEKVGFKVEVKRVEEGHCPFCNEKIDTSTFRDALSKRKYEISGLCQACQDNMFGDKEG
jgi:hypothetical protein